MQTNGCVGACLGGGQRATRWRPPPGQSNRTPGMRDIYGRLLFHQTLHMQPPDISATALHVYSRWKFLLWDAHRRFSHARTFMSGKNATNRKSANHCCAAPYAAFLCAKDSRTKPKISASCTAPGDKKTWAKNTSRRTTLFA